MVADTQSPFPPPAGTTDFNPDVALTQFYSEYNGFTLTTVNATWMRVDFYLVNCSAVLFTGACSPTVIGPLNTQYHPAKAITSTAVTYIAAAVTLSGYTAASFSTAAQTAFKAAVAADLGVAASAVTITSVADAAAAGGRRHVLQAGSIVVGFAVSTPASGAAAVAAGIVNGMTVAQLTAAGLTSATGVAVTAAPTSSATAPVATAAVSAAPAASALVALAAAAAALLL
jgi:hypothetical protein